MNRINSLISLRTLAGCAAGLAAYAAAAPALASINTVATMDTDVLGAALRPSGLSIDAIIIKNGVPGQFGT